MKVVDPDQMEILGIPSATDGEVYVLSWIPEDPRFYELRLQSNRKGIKIPSIRIDSELIDELNATNKGSLTMIVKDVDYYWQR